MAFIFTIYPSLVLTYAGQTAYLTKNLNDHRDGFYKFVPGPVYWPMFVIATSAAVVASQSLISATFSVIKQSVALDYFPRVKIVHTSAIKEGEVYSPETNYILMILCVTAILGFGDGQDMGNAFGMELPSLLIISCLKFIIQLLVNTQIRISGVVVILVMFITTILLTLVMIIVWRIPILVAGLYFIPFFIMEGVYVSAVCTKIVEGGWFPFVISIILASIMFGWYYGRQKKLDYEMTNKITVESLGGLISSSETERVPGLCLFYTNVQDGFTPILGHYIKNLHSFHKVTIFTTFRYLLAAKVDPNERIIVRKFGLTGIYGCIIQYGYADFHSPAADELVNQIISSLKTYISNNSNGLLPTLVDEEILQLEEAKSTSVVYVKGKTRFQTGKETGWFDRIILGFYEFLHRNCRSAVPNIGIPLQQNIEIGMLYKA